MAQMVKNLPAVQETQVRSLGQEDPVGREWLPTPVFLSGEFHGQRSLVGYSPWGHKESDTAERLTLSLTTPLLRVVFMSSSIVCMIFLETGSLCQLLHF